MNSKIILFVFFLVLISFAYSDSISSIGTVEKFDKILIDGKEAYTTPDLYKSDVFIASDKYFYGSKDGVVNVTVYFQAKKAGNYSFGLETKSKSITLKSLETGKGKGKDELSGISIKPTETFFIDETTKEISFTIAFNPAIIGMQEEFDIIVYDEFGTEISRLDPFISGWQYRFPITIKAKTAYAPYTFILDVNGQNLGDQNAGFWNFQKVDGTDIRFAAYSDGTTLYDYQRLYYNHDNNAGFNVRIPSLPATDFNIFVYYGNLGASNTSITVRQDYNFDSFEDGNYTTSPTWTLDSGGVDVNVTAAYDGSYGLFLRGGAEIHASIPDSNKAQKISVWMYSPADGGACARFFKLNNDATNYVTVKMNANCDEGRGIYYYDSTATYNLLYTTAASTWYRVEIDYYKNDIEAVYKVYNTAGTALAEAKGATVAAGNPNHIVFITSAGVPGMYDDINANYPQFAYVLDANEVGTGVYVDFNYNVPNNLDPENNVNSVTVALTNTSQMAGYLRVQDYNWLSNGVLFSNDSNTTKAYTTAADYNVCLAVNYKEYDDSNIVSHFSFDSNEGNIAVNDVNVSYNATNIAAGISPSKANFDYAMDYNGSGYSTTINNLIDYNNSTICMWVNVRDVTAKGSGLTSQTFLQLYKDANNNLRIGNDDTATGGGGVYVSYKYQGVNYGRKTAGGKLANNTWAHVCSVFSANNVDIYVNNVLSDNADASNFVDTVNRIGTQSTTTGGMNGLLDDLRIYNVAKSVSDINNLYYRTSDFLGSTTTPATVSASVCKTITISQAAQAVAINYDINHYLATDVNVLFKGTGTGIVDNWYWQYDGNYFGSDQNVQRIFTAADTDVNICLTAKIGDINKVKCERFYISQTIIKKPIDQADMTTVVTPFRLRVNSTPSQDYSSLTNDTNIFLFSTGAANFTLAIDTNADYFTQNFILSPLSGLTTIQPYLVSAATGTAIKIIVQNKSNYDPVQNVTLLVYKSSVTGTKFLLESVITDSKGEAYITGIINNSYDIDVYYLGNLVYQPTLLITATTAYIYFTTSSVQALPPGAWIDVAMFPANSKLLSDENLLSQYINVVNAGVTDVNIVMTADGNVYYTHLITDCNSGCSNSFYVSDVPLWDLNTDVVLTVYVHLNGGATFRKSMYYSRHSSYGLPLFQVLKRTIHLDFFGCDPNAPYGCGMAMILSMLLTLGIIITINLSNLFRTPEATFIMAIIISGFFVIINWLPLVWWALFAFMGIVATYFYMRMKRGL